MARAGAGHSSVHLVSALEGAHEALRHRHHDERRAHQHDAGCRRGGQLSSEQRCDPCARARRASARAGRRAAAARERAGVTRTRAARRRRGRGIASGKVDAAASQGSRRACGRLRRRGTPRAARSTAAARRAGTRSDQASSTPCSWQQRSGRPITPPASSARLSNPAGPSITSQP